jgi:uncharacterized iron-regulated membrane protein
VSFTITDGRSWNAFARSQLTVDAATGDVRQWQPYESNTLGQKARGWFRFAHTGELAGILGQMIAGIACAGGVVLVWTGLSLALRRLFNWHVWRRLGAQRPVVLPTDLSGPYQLNVKGPHHALNQDLRAVPTERPLCISNRRATSDATTAVTD